MPDNTANDPGPSGITLLSDLLTRLYPDPGPNILTLADFKLRYRLTGWGPLAVAGIQQTQRINQDVGNFEDRGLCEFHIGLIYLHLDDFQGAVQQFREARLRWSFVNKTAAVSLAYLAEGIAQQQRYAFETALALLSKAESYQKRIQFEPSSENRDGFVAVLNTVLQKAQTETHQALLAAEAAQSAALVKNIKRDDEDTAVSPATPPTQEKATPQPILNLSSPIPHHPNNSQSQNWYQAQWQQPAPTFTTVKDKSWLLTRPLTIETVCPKGALLIITSDTRSEQAAVVLEPLQKRTQPTPYFYLARKDFAGPFTTTGNQITLSAENRPIVIDFANISGCVIGLWLETEESEILEN